MPKTIRLKKGLNIRITGKAKPVPAGTKVSADGYLGFYDSMVSIIPEGNDYEFMGWARSRTDAVHKMLYNPGVPAENILFDDFGG
jgi:Na+-transporting NADH:ubiquinone oxidoreductase subunit NqrA